MNRLKRDVARHFNIDPATAGSLISGLLALMIDEQTGGIEGFIACLRSAGLGRAVDSWIDGISLESMNEKQVKRALGRATIEDLATEAGLGRGGTAAILTYLVPRLVNRASPGGKVPTTEELRVRTGRFREAHDGRVARPGRRDPARRGADDEAGDVGYRGPARRRHRPALLVLAWLMVPALALAAWLFVRPIIPAAENDGEPPVLEVNNDGDTVTYAGRVRDEVARATIIEALNSTFGEGRVTGEVSVDGDVEEARWVERLDTLLVTLDLPGAVLVLTGDSALVGGRLTDEQRGRLAERVRNALAGTAAVSAGDSAEPVTGDEEIPAADDGSDDDEEIPAADDASDDE